MQTFPELIERFGGAATMAPLVGVPANTIRQWSSRRNIPGRYWKSIISAAQQVGLDAVTADKLAELASRSDAGNGAEAGATAANAADSESTVSS